MEVGQQNRRYCPSLSAVLGTDRQLGIILLKKNERGGHEEAKRRLSNLILNKTVDIKNAKTIDDYGRLVADVYYKGRNLADYFPEYKT